MFPSMLKYAKGGKQESDLPDWGLRQPE